MSKEDFEKLINAVVNDKSTADKLVSSDPKIIEAKNGIGETALHYLAVENQLNDVAWLLDHGAEINTTNDFGNTPLSEAASLGYCKLCDFLIHNGADPKIRTSQGDTALSEAATNDEHEVVELLLKYVGPDESIKRYFSKITYDVLLDKESKSAKLIQRKGLAW